MCAGVPGRGAEDGWWLTALDLEEAHIGRTAFAGGAIDIWKCFDQFNRRLVYLLAEKAGMPKRILEAYQRFQEVLTVRNTVCGGLGE